MTYIISRRKNKKELSQVIQAIINSIDPETNFWTRRNPSKIQSSVIVDLDKDSNEINSYLTPVHNSLVDLRPDLLLEWNYDKNGSLTPNMFGINSNNHVWWKCKTCGHEWKTTIIQRGGTRNSSCPKCSNSQRGKTFTELQVKEKGSLAENNPLLSQEWHPSKNNGLSPLDVTEKSPKKVWWLCKKCSHEWKASLLNRSKGVGCPACSGRVPRIGQNDLKTLYPAIASEWNYERNYPLVPEQYLPKSGKRVWWKCSVCHYEWETVIRTRTDGHNCPICSKKHPKEANHEP
jgi:DNA-directed RNA polymerase subunit RPC12/RpoP